MLNKSVGIMNTPLHHITQVPCLYQFGIEHGPELLNMEDLFFWVQFKLLLTNQQYLHASVQQGNGTQK
jgi:hypothetical protein